MRCAILPIGIVVCALSTRAAAVTFTDVTAAAGITHVHATTGALPSEAGAGFFAGGAAAGDFDGDGLVDLIFTRLSASEILYRNRGDGTFEARTSAAGFTSPRLANGIASGDIDNDGDLDLYVTTTGGTRNSLYFNDGQAFFTDAGAAEPAALASNLPRYGQGVSFGDYDDDGYLDLATGDWGSHVEQSTSRLLRNRGGAQAGQFEDRTVAAGLDAYRDEWSWRYSPRFVDLDRDGRMDLTFASDFHSSQLFWNNGDGTFTDGTIPSHVGTDLNGMGTALGDFDGDGDLDWFITNITSAPGVNSGFSGWNRLYRNDGGRSFTDVTEAAGVRDSRWSWGTSFFDYDNDGDLDLAATNGYSTAGWVDDRTVLWQNDGGTFTDVSLAAGVTDTQQGRGLVHLDYDDDGDLDMVVVNNGAATPILYRNDGGNENHFLRIETEGTHSNRDGIGAWITVTPDLDDPTRRMVWEIDGGSSFLSQSEHTAHFGLGAAAGNIDLVTIEWPSGTIQRLLNISPDQTLHVVEPTEWYAADFDGDGDVDGDDLAQWQAVCGLNAAGDANLDGASDGRDLLIWQREFTAGAAIANSAAIPEPAAALLAAVGLAMLVKRGSLR